MSPVPVCVRLEHGKPQRGDSFPLEVFFTVVRFEVQRFYLFLLLHSGCSCLPSQTMQGRPSRGTPVEGRGEQDVVAPSVMGDEGLTQAGARVSPWLVSDTCCSLSV